MSRIPTHPTHPPGKSSGATDQTSHAPIAGAECRQGAMGGAFTALIVAGQNHITTGGGGADSLTFANTKRQTVNKTCEFCGGVFETSRPTSARYCSGYCRRRAWLANNPGRAAELAAGDKARLRAHFERRGLDWQE